MCNSIGISYHTTQTCCNYGLGLGLVLLDMIFWDESFSNPSIKLMECCKFKFHDIVKLLMNHPYIWNSKHHCIKNKWVGYIRAFKSNLNYQVAHLLTLNMLGVLGFPSRQKETIWKNEHWCFTDMNMSPLTLDH